MTDNQKKLGDNIIVAFVVITIFLITIRVSASFIGATTEKQEIRELQKENLELKNKILRVHLKKTAQ